MGTMDTKSWPQGVNSYKLNLFIMDVVVIRWIPYPNQVNLHRVNPIWSGWWAMKGDFKSSVTVYQTINLQNSERHFQNGALHYYFLHAALRCSSFRLKTVICLRLYICSWYVQFCILMKDSVFALWINKLKCTLKTSVSLVLATEHLNL